MCRSVSRGNSPPPHVLDEGPRVPPAIADLGVGSCSAASTAGASGRGHWGAGASGRGRWGTTSADRAPRPSSSSIDPDASCLAPGRTHQVHNPFKDKDLESSVRADGSRKSFHGNGLQIWCVRPGVKHPAGWLHGTKTRGHPDYVDNYINAAGAATQSQRWNPRSPGTPAPTRRARERWTQ
jgi:hypothetical protein